MTNTAFAPEKGMSVAGIDATVDAILSNTTLAEKVAMMSGKGFFEAYVADGKVWAALADLLDGSVSPSAKLPFTVMCDESDYPFFDPDAGSIEYGSYHGYTMAEREGLAVQFPFGFGLSYTQFDYAGLAASIEGQSTVAEIDVTNMGQTDGEEIVLLYVGFPGTDCERPQRLLKAFTRASLTPSETKHVTLHVALDDLRWWNPATHGWSMEAGEYRVTVGDQAVTITL